MLIPYNNDILVGPIVSLLRDAPKLIGVQCFTYTFRLCSSIVYDILAGSFYASFIGLYDRTCTETDTINNPGSPTDTCIL